MSEDRSRDPVTHHVLALGAVLCVMAAFFTLLFVKPPESNRDAVNLVLGVLLSVGFTNVYQFYFGSSQGARDNRDQLNRQADKLAEAAATATVAAATSTQPVSGPAGASADGTVTLAPGENVTVEAAVDQHEEDPTMFGGPRP